MNGISAGARPEAGLVWGPSGGTDMAEEFEKAERVLNSLTGRRDSTTPRMVYQDQQSRNVLTRTAELREKLRSDDVVESSHEAASRDGGADAPRMVQLRRGNG